MRKHPAFALATIALIALVAIFFIYPGGFGGRVLPWRLGLDLVGGSHLTYEVDMSGVADADRASVHAGLRDVIERRVNLFGVSEPQVVSARSGGAYRLIVELAGIRDVSAAIREIGATPFLLFAEVEESSASGVSSELSGATSTAPQEQPNITPTELTGRYVRGAQLSFDQVTGQAQVSLEFDAEGAKLFEQITTRNVGKPLAVFLDNQLITAPVVQEPIAGGRAQITGNFSLEEARELVSRFNAGALPAPIRLIGQDTVGATLGADSLAKTLFAGFVGTLIVMLFMVGYYRTFGLYAGVALVIYIALTLGIFKLFGVTLTLAGIAGVILSIGMAVDANILTFERTREELARGAARGAAIEEGFRRAWPSIRDSNVTTIITSLILFTLTTGFVKGFALALLIGVIVSMFSAITVTRSIMRTFVTNDQ